MCVVVLASALCCCFATSARIAPRCRYSIVYLMVRTPSSATTLTCLIVFFLPFLMVFIYSSVFFLSLFLFSFLPLLFITSGGGTLGSWRTRHTLAAGAGLLGRRDTGAGREERSRNSLPPPGESPQEERLPQAPHLRHQQGSFSLFRSRLTLVFRLVELSEHCKTVAVHPVYATLRTTTSCTILL